MTIANFNVDPTVDSFGQPVSGYEQVVDRNLQLIANKSNESIDNINILNNIVLDSSSGVTVSDILPLFEVFAQETINFPAIEFGSNVIVTLYPSVDYTIPAGTYITPSAIHQVEIEKIIDSDNFVKMRIEERDFLLTLNENLGGGGDTPLLFRPKIGDNAPLNTTTQLEAGQFLSISQLSGDSPDVPVKIRIDSTVPYEYYHKSRYNIIPTQPDPTNPYRYKVSTTPYIPGSLRVYIDTHRIPEEKLDETFAGIGEFWFKNNIPVSELPTSSSGDFISCDFDIPFFTGPTNTLNAISSGKWWGDIVTYTDSGVLSPDEFSSLRFFPVYGSFTSMGSSAPLQIRNTNPYGITDTSIDSVYIILDISQIDHSQLKNFNTADYFHHNEHIDDQFIWKTIVDSSNVTMDPQAVDSTLSFTSSDNSVSIDGMNGILDFKAVNIHAPHSDDQVIWYGISDPNSFVLVPSTTTTQLNMTNSDGLVNIDNSTAPATIDFSLNIQSGFATFTLGQLSKVVTLGTTMANLNYKIFCTMEQFVEQDGDPDFPIISIGFGKTVNSFTINISTSVDDLTDVWRVHWLVIP